MHERRLIGSFGYRVDVFKTEEPKTLLERFLRKPHLERVNVIGGLLPKGQAEEMVKIFSEKKDGLIYKAVREIPPDYII
jgi:hypothetical protein